MIARIAAIQQTWAQLPILPGPLLEPMQQRFATVYQALHDPDAGADLADALEQQPEAQAAWCVCMEIIAGVESPPDRAQLRMEYQVARLSASLAGGTVVKSDALYDPPSSCRSSGS